MATCSTSLKLYDGANFGTPVLQILTRTQWINLSGYGFDNKTSSFKVGACSTYLADLTMGGGDWYPTSGSTAGKEVQTMNTGWNNRVSSVYLQ